MVTTVTLFAVISQGRNTVLPSALAMLLDAESTFGLTVLFSQRTAFTKVSHADLPLRSHHTHTKAGIAFKDLPKTQFFPSIGMKRPGAQLRVNFGQAPFLFDIDGMVAVRNLCCLSRHWSLMVAVTKFEGQRRDQCD